MNIPLLLAAALAASAASAAAPEPAQPAAPAAGAHQATTYDPNEMVCRRVQEIGSRLRAARMCLTRAQWAQQVREDRQNAEHAQSQRNPRAY